MNTVRSTDGTIIAYDRQGEGPAVILVDGSQFAVTRAKDLRAHIVRDKGRLAPPQLARLRGRLVPAAAGTR